MLPPFDQVEVGLLTVCDSAADQDANKRPETQAAAVEGLPGSRNRVLGRRSHFNARDRGAPVSLREPERSAG
jgi:hypothetical protein